MAGILAMPNRESSARHLHVSKRRPDSVDEVSDTREQRARSAREDRAMLLGAGWGGSWRADASAA
jgi:hypothetical protein